MREMSKQMKRNGGDLIVGDRYHDAENCKLLQTTRLGRDYFAELLKVVRAISPDLDSIVYSSEGANISTRRKLQGHQLDEYSGQGL